MATVFFSYSHKDEELRNRLETALSTMKRQGLIEAWHDRRLRAGDNIDHGVKAELDRADVILLLVSPDFIASDYCHDVEMARALERHRKGEARVIPVILRACDWHPMPFGELLAAPRDGKPIKSWPDLDEAFLDVVTAIRNALPQTPQPAAARQPVAPLAMAEVGPRSSNLRLKRSFTEADRDRFLNDAFEFMAKFFEGSLSELKARNPGIETTFRKVDANRFTAVIYQNGKAVARGSVVLGGMFGKGISFSANDQAATNSFNENMTVESDDQSLFLKSMGMQRFAGGRRESKLTFEGAAEEYWDLMIQPLQR